MTGVLAGEADGPVVPTISAIREGARIAWPPRALIVESGTRPG